MRIAESRTAPAPGRFRGAGDPARTGPRTPLDDLRALYRYPISTASSRPSAWSGNALRTPGDYALGHTRGCWNGWRRRTCATPRSFWRRAWCCGRGRNSRRSSTRSARRRPARRSRCAGFWTRCGSSAWSRRCRWRELAAERVNQGVVAFGIGGSEERGPAEWFSEVFAVRQERRAAAHGARRRERTGRNRSGRRCELGAERIGHGIASIERSRVGAPPARSRYSARDLHHQQPGDRRGEAPRRPPGAAPVRRRRADRV